MSKNEYSFQSRQNRNFSSLTSQNKSTTLPINNIKVIILEEYDKFLNLKLCDKKIKYLSESQEKLSKEILSTFASLQKSESKEITAQLSQKLNNLTILHKKLKDEYTELLKTELNVLYNGWPDIFEKIIEGVNRETLEHVLTVFEEYKKGSLNANQAVTQGMDYMSLRYNLPKDFFDKNAVDQYNKNLYKEN